MAALRRRAWLGLWALPVGAREAAETLLRAAYLLRFLAYIEWPDSQAAPPLLRIGVLDDEALADAVEGLLRDRRADETPARLQRLRRGEPLRELHLLYSAETLPEPLPGLLTVGEQGQGRPCIRFLLHEQRVRFIVDLTQVRRSGLRLNSRLLAVALQVLRED